MSDSRIEARLKVPSDVGLLGLLGDWLSSLARGIRGADLVPDLEMNLRLVITELFTNCLRHAYCGRNDGQIELEFAATSRTLELSVHDWGPGPNPEFDVNRLSLPLNNEESARGRGLFIVRQLVDRLSFVRSASRNTFTATIDIPEAGLTDEELLLAFLAEQQHGDEDTHP